mmetsp:Transcript_31347/g.66246  ORF Transcript_31347/g.66246 Transcript_31347/m.66246 type:complete len:607 (+) Transcript_31347:196-2016(+)
MMVTMKTYDRTEPDPTRNPSHSRSHASETKHPSQDHLPAHAFHMRNALRDCQRMMDTLRRQVDDFTECEGIIFSIRSSEEASDRNGSMTNELRTIELLRSAYMSAKTYLQMREDGLKFTYQRMASDSKQIPPIDVVSVDETGRFWHTSPLSKQEGGANCHQLLKSIHQFKQKYCDKNVPCLIRGLEKSHFKDISSQWRKSSIRQIEMYSEPARGVISDACNSNAAPSANSQTIVNTEWFSTFVGDDSMVPVRINNNQPGRGSNLDDDGRAQECETMEMKLSEWIDECRDHEEQFHASGRSGERRPRDNIGYLKDWHLVNFLSQRNESLPSWPLYTTPSFFQRDLLNDFLRRYSDGGDYKFVYWGPSGSATTLHSDVLHSYSWSYNVVGMKKWIFHIPELQRDNGDDDGRGEHYNSKQFEVIQNTGETIFVPATWKHEVINLLETISINHNWITAANVDLSWQCLLTEISSIETELQSWGHIPDLDFAARENMLRGCIGLDVTSFFFMVLVELIRLLSSLYGVDCDESVGEELDSSEDRLLDLTSAIFRLRNMLCIIMENSMEIIDVGDCDVHLEKRLSSVLESQELANEALSCATNVVKMTDRFEP